MTASYKERGDDLYQTPSCATEALLRVESLPKFIWEPAAGKGAIVNILRRAGHKCIASDLVEYGDPTHFARRDFLMETCAPKNCEAIVTNPPYKLANEFVRHALKLVPKVYMLLRLLFIEGNNRSDIIDGGRLRRVHAFSRRLPMMHRENWQGNIASSQTAFAWFVWDDGIGPTVIDRINWHGEWDIHCKVLTKRPVESLEFGLQLDWLNSNA